MPFHAIKPHDLCSPRRNPDAVWTGSLPEEYAGFPNSDEDLSLPRGSSDSVVVGCETLRECPAMKTVAVWIALTACFVVGALPGQTTGVPGMNDYTINCVGCGTTNPPCFPATATPGAGGVSGSTSCTPLWFNVSAGGTFTFQVSCAPNVPVSIFLDFCPCIPCWLPLPPVCGIPFTACGGTTNQSVDIDLTCPWSTPFSGTSSPTGVFTATIIVPPLPPLTCVRLSTQALVGSNLACVGPFLVSQAYDLYLGG